MNLKKKNIFLFLHSKFTISTFSLCDDHLSFDIFQDNNLGNKLQIGLKNSGRFSKFIDKLASKLTMKIFMKKFILFI